MAPAVKPKPAPAAGPATFMLGDMSAYSTGGGIPEGDYALSFDVQMFEATKKDGSSAGPARLGVMVTCAPMGGGDAKSQFYSMGSNAHLSWAPDAETGKKIVAVPGGPGTPPNNQTNWAVFLEQLYNSGLPQGVLQDDVSVLDGVWVHMSNVPEPEGRKGFEAQTGEVAVERKSRTIAVVTEIKDDGKPWEGGGGMPETATEEAPSPVPAKPAAKVATKVAPKAAAKAAIVQAAPEPAEGAEDVEAFAQSYAADILGNNPKGMGKMLFRTSMFKAINTADATQTKTVMDTFFGTDDALNGLINPLGWKVVGPNIVVS